MADALTSGHEMSLLTTRSAFDDDHDAFRESVRRFLRSEVEPHLDAWRAANTVPAEFFLKAGKEGLLGTAAPEEFGGGGVDDLRFLAVVVEEAATLGAIGLAHVLAAHSGVVLPTLVRYGSAAACAAWVPVLVAGERLAVPLGVGNPIEGEIAGGHAELRGSFSGVPGGDGAKIYLTSVSHAGEAGFVILPADRSGVTEVSVSDSLGGREGGQTDVTLDAVFIGVTDIIGAGARNDVLRDLDLWSAVIAAASSRSVLAMTLEYVAERRVFGRPLAEFENTRYRLAEVSARLAAVEALVDSCLVARSANRLTAAAAATARLEAAAAHDHMVDCGLQFHGGYGYMREYPISHAYADAQYLRLQEKSVTDARDTIAVTLGL